VSQLAKKKKAKKTIHLPAMNDVETRKNLIEGDYVVEVTGVEQKESEKSEYDYLKWELTVNAGPYKGNKIWTNTSFNPKALWNLKNLLVALEADIPDEPEDIAIDEFLGLEMTVTVEMDSSYDGTARPQVIEYSPVGGSEDGEDIEVKDGDEDDDDDKLEKLTEDNIREMDEEELGDVVKKYDLDVSFKKAKNLRKKVALVIDAMEEGDYIEDEDDD